MLAKAPAPGGPPHRTTPTGQQRRRASFREHAAVAVSPAQPPVPRKVPGARAETWRLAHVAAETQGTGRPAAAGSGPGGPSGTSARTLWELQILAYAIMGDS